MERITKAVLIDIVLANETEEFLTYAEEYREEIDKLKSNMFWLKLEFAHWYMYIMLQHYDNRREFAEAVKKCPGIVQPYLFKNYEQMFSFDDYVKDWNGKKWEKALDSYGGNQ